MSWLDDLLKKLPEAEIQVLNDAKSPSGRPHVGSLRGILIHDAPYRFLQEKGIPVKYLYGSDDYDPLDEIPGGQSVEKYEKYLGQPLCNTPAPEGSAYEDIAMHYITDFYKIFDEIGVYTEKYYMRDIYRKGIFNEGIDRVLTNVDVIRKIYLDVSKSERASNWYPYQVVCDKCGRIGTTQVTDYDGKEVTYTCRTDLVTWAKGCGHTGKKSPFDGGGKMPFKVEWAAKWKYLGVTIEGAGTDHNTRGGSRDVAEAVCRKVFDRQPPINIPYGFFVLGGAKMSSSKGIGVTARGMADFLPPEILRYLMISAQPKREVNFEPTENYIVKLFNDFDKLHQKWVNGEQLADFEESNYKLSQVFYKEKYYNAEFPLILTLVQMPHIDIYKEVEKRKGSALTEVEIKNIDARVKSAKYWLDNYATDEDKVTLQETLPESAKNLTDSQRAFLHKVAELLENAEWNDHDLQAAVFTATRLTSVNQKEAFLAFYNVLLNKAAGPKAGNLLSCLKKDFLVKRFTELNFNKLNYYTETALSYEEASKWFSKEAAKINAISFVNEIIENKAFVDYTITMVDEKQFVKRFLIDNCETNNELHLKAKELLEKIKHDFSLNF
jgi:lysyl-tRNA synthetase class 1